MTTSVDHCGVLTAYASHFTPKRDDTPPILKPDAAGGMECLRKRHAGMVILFDSRKLLPRNTDGVAWTGVNNIANFEPLPRSMILHYIQRSATAYKRPGWIMMDADHLWWLKAFETAYDVREKRSFGTFDAYYMVPRQPAASGHLPSL